MQHTLDKAMNQNTAVCKQNTILRLSTIDFTFFSRFSRQGTQASQFPALLHLFGPVGGRYRSQSLRGATVQWGLSISGHMYSKDADNPLEARLREIKTVHIESGVLDLS